MKVNILTEKSDWIMNRAAQELTPLGYTVNQEPGHADIDYYLPYLGFKLKNKNIQIGFFTHLEHSRQSDPNIEKKIAKFYAFRKEFDACIAISERTKQQLQREAPVIKMGSQFKKDIIFGICGKVHESGRKNEHFVAQMVADGFNVLAWGHGWPCEIYSNSLENLNSFYTKIDYLVVPSSIEGGPVPVLEAISLGKGVIAPDVGWCFDFPVIQYEKNNYDSLKKVLTGLTSVPTWEDWRQEHQKFFTEVFNAKHFKA